MKSFKKYIIGIGATFALALTVTGVALAHGGGNIPSSGASNSFMGGMGMMMDNFDWEDMNLMHDLMWKSGDLTQEEFNTLRNLQIDHMGWSHLDNDTLDEFNEQTNSKFGHHGMMMGGYDDNMDSPMMR